jgi:hypothetical protein
MELGTDSRREKVMWLTAKYWQQIMCMGIDKPLGQCYKDSGSQGKQIKEKLENIYFGFTWQKQQESNTTK